MVHLSWTARRDAAACAGGVVLVPGGTWVTGPFNLSSNTVLRVEGVISGSQDPAAYPIVTQQPLDEAYRVRVPRARVCTQHRTAAFDSSSPPSPTTTATTATLTHTDVHIHTRTHARTHAQAPWMKNRQRQALVSAYSAHNITVIGNGTIDGNGWQWWKNVTEQVRPSACVCAVGPRAHF